MVAASQKGLGCPPGLSITCASQKALKVLENRKSPVTSYFASWKKWLPASVPATAFSISCFPLLNWCGHRFTKPTTKGKLPISRRKHRHRA